MNLRKSGTTAVLGLSALGVVFGDIGTSPLYVLKAVFSIVDLTDENVMGAISSIFWCLLIIVSFKYVTLVLRADNHGEGGILALSTLIKKFIPTPSRLATLATILGVFGAALFFGDSVITPAISVLSAVEGLEVAFENMPNIVVPVALVILTALFAVQRHGTHSVGRIFGPLMALWFVLLAALGLPHILAHPEILGALSPHHAFIFVAAHPVLSFLAMGAMVLALTGAEALYADIAHFGRQPIQAAWFALVLPALTVNYLGQGALLITKPEALENPFFFLTPSWGTVPLVVMATIATLIASQAVISGAFSIARQAGRLGYLPHLRVMHTSAKESGQIYMPAVNWLLYVAVAIVVVVFQNSEKLSSAYGLAVTTDFLITTTMLLLLTHYGWKWRTWATLALGVGLLALEIPLWAANVTKIVSGGWLPLGIALTLAAIMATWHKGEVVVAHERLDLEENLTDFLERLQKNPPRRIPGTAIYPHSLFSTTPRPLKLNTDINHTLHDHVIIFSMKTLPTPHVPDDKRVTLRTPANAFPGFKHLEIRYGFMDFRDPIGAMTAARDKLGVNLDQAQFMLSHLEIVEGLEHTMWRPQKKLFMWLSKLSASPMWISKLPVGRTVEFVSRVEI